MRQLLVRSDQQLKLPGLRIRAVDSTNRALPETGRSIVEAVRGLVCAIDRREQEIPLPASPELPFLRPGPMHPEICPKAKVSFNIAPGVCLAACIGVDLLGCSADAVFAGKGWVGVKMAAKQLKKHVELF